jgi:dinuclear metal center YbgI/SA1388 family protein
MTTYGHHIQSYLDEYLRISEVRDSVEALNGMQVSHEGEVTMLAAAVDACQTTIDAAAELGAEFMLVHHGLFWGGLQPLTGRHGRRVRTLMTKGIALYSAHMPLDLHPEVGNNAVLAKELGIDGREWFGDYKGEQLGVAGHLNVSIAELEKRVAGVVGSAPRVLAHGPELVSKVGIISGGGGDMIAQARDAGVDTFITGEGKHHSYFDAEEWSMNVIYAGHYATETLGVRALAEHISSKFGLPWNFLDHPTGM